MRKLLLFTVPFALAALLCTYLISTAAALGLALLALGGLIAVRLLHPKRAAPMRILLLGLCLGLVYCALYGVFLTQPIHAADGTLQDRRMQICDYPSQTRYGCQATARLTVNGRQTTALVYLPDSCQTLQPGDWVQCTLELRRADRNREGEQYFYYQAQGIQLLGYARSAPQIERCARTPLRLLPKRLSHRMYLLLAAAVPQDAAGLAQALLTGDRSGLSYAQKSDFTMAGVSHMIAISGMHVSILLGFLALVTLRRRRLTALLGIPVVLLYVFVTGGAPSAVRAAIMQILLLLAPLLWRENDGPSAMSAALLLLLLQNPDAIANVGLQLSFAAMGGMLWATRPIYLRLAGRKWAEALLNRKQKKQPWAVRALRVAGALAARFVFASVSATLGALLFTLPISALQFGTLSLYALFSNLLILWAVSLCFVGGLVTVVLAWIWLPLGQAVGWLVAWPLRYILSAAKLLAGLPFALLSTDQPYLPIWLFTAYCLLVLGLLWRKTALPAAGIVLSLLLCLGLSRLDAAPRECSIAALDVGQGQCICMLTPDFSAVYDCGGSRGDADGQHAAEYLLRAGIRRLDALVLSHYDEDHISGVAQLLYRVRADRLYLPLTAEDDAGRAEMEALAMQYDIPISYVTQEQQLDFSGGHLRIFPPVLQKDANSGSLSILFSCQNYDMLATGDMDGYAENLLLHRVLLPEVELLIAGHHGAGDSGSMALLETVRPKTVLVSVGYNRYGHPTQEALDRFTAIGAAVYRTDQCGDITIRR